MNGELNIVTNKEIDTTKWNALYAKNRFASPFQSVDFYILFNGLENQSAMVFALENEGNYTDLCVVTFQKEPGLKGYFSRRAIIYGGPLISSENGFRILLNYIEKSIKAKVIYTETRNLFDYKAYDSIYKSNGWEYQPYLNFELNINGLSLQQILSKMKYNRKREIRISQESKAYYSETKEESEIEELYKILKDLYSNRVKLPLPNIQYFISLFNSEIGKIIVVKHNSKIIGGAFALYKKNERIYTLYYCGLRDYDKKIFPTHLAVLGVIDYGIKNDIKVVDFMGAGVKGKEYGVRKYKEEFGGTLVEQGRYLKINNQGLYSLGKLGLKILKKVHLN